MGTQPTGGSTSRYSATIGEFNQQPYQQQPYNQQPYQQPYQQSYQQPRQQPYQQPYQQPHPQHTMYNSNNFFTGLFHSVFSSTTFLVAIILLTGGKLLNFFISFNTTNLLTLMLSALPVIAYWLIYAASKAPKLPEKSLPALTLFKIEAIINLIGECVVALIMLIASIILFRLSTGLGLLMLVLTGILTTWAVVFVRAYLQVLLSLRNGITYNSVGSLQGIKTYSIMSYISIGLSALIVLITAMSAAAIGALYGSIKDMLSFLPSEITSLLPSLGRSAVTFSTLFTLASSAGQIIAIVVLNQFNNSLENSRY